MAGEMNVQQMQRMATLAPSRVARLQAPELFHSQSVTITSAGGSQSIQIPKTLNINRPLESMTIQLKGRLAVTVGNYADPAPQSFSNLMQSIWLQGTHRVFGSVTTVRMSGAMAFVWPRLFNAIGNDLIINGTRVADPGRPYADESVLTTAASPYDFVVQWHVPFGPIFSPGPNVRSNAATFYLQPQDWQDTLQLQLTLGDSSALGDPTGATTAWTAFGSGSGSPQLSVHLNYAILGELRDQIRSRVLVRNEQPLSAFTSLTTATRLALLQHQTTTNIVLKTGVRETTLQSGGIVTFESLSDVQMDRTQIMVDMKPIRNNQDNLIQKSYYGRQFGTIAPQGHLVLSFVDGQNALLAYPGKALPGGAQLELVSDVISANANNLQSFVQEMILDY